MQIEEECLIESPVMLGKSLLRLYVSGGGTRKSFLIKTIKCWIKLNQNKDSAVTAPTVLKKYQCIESRARP